MKNYVSLKSLSLLLCFALFSAAAMAQGQSSQSKAPAPGGASKATPATPTTPAKPAASKELIDLNTATKKELMTLTGIGDALSQKIIDNRPYRAKNELTQKKIITESEYDKIKDLIIAKQGATPATPATPSTSKATPATPSKAPASNTPAKK